MIGVIIGAHGDFAPGLKSAGQMIFGEQENVETVQLLPNMGPADFDAKLNEAVQKLSACSELIILVDFWGGTPFNRSSNLQLSVEKPIAIITGANMPMIVELYSSRDGYQSAEELAKYLETASKEGIQISLKTDKAEPVKDELADLL